MRAVNAAVAEAERAAAAPGGWFSRVTACLGAREDVLIAINPRPEPSPPGGASPGGDQAWGEVRERLDDADRRSSDAWAPESSGADQALGVR